MKKIIDDFFKKFKKDSAENYFEFNEFSLEKAISKFNDSDYFKGQEIYELLSNLEECIDIEDIDNELDLNTCFISDSIDEIVAKLTNAVKIDYNDSFSESKKEGWDFQYFVDKNKFVNNALVVGNYIYYPKKDKLGSTLYNISIIKKKGKSYYYWNMLD